MSHLSRRQFLKITRGTVQHCGDRALCLVLLGEVGAPRDGFMTRGEIVALEALPAHSERSCRHYPCRCDEKLAEAQAEIVRLNHRLHELIEEP